jgi:RluA family pseudouridine synthase
VHSRTTIKAEQEIGKIRIDRFLKEEANLTHSAICKFLKLGKVLINGKRCRELGLQVVGGDVVELLGVEIVPRLDKEVMIMDTIRKKTQEIRDAIVFENEKILVINKPYGISSQSGNKAGVSLDLVMKNICPSARIVHRLDKETSGVMVFAKTREVAQIMFNAFKDREIKKVYIACVKGCPNKDSGIIKTNITKSSKDRHSYEISEAEGKIAITQYEVIKGDVNKNMALLRLFPQTGRTHQLRVHCSQFLNTPIIGDNRYSNNSKKTKLNLFAESITLPKLVHPVKICINHLPEYFLIKG